ncbi:hypothetical protein Tco_0663805 [Tanacetum coccineum]
MSGVKAIDRRSYKIRATYPLNKRNKEGKGEDFQHLIRSNSSYNLLLERTAMQTMGFIVSTIHVAIKFHTPCGIGIVFATYKPNKVEEGHQKVKETVLEVTEDVLNYVDVEERIITNDKHPEQTVVIRKQLLTSFKRKLQDLL